MNDIAIMDYVASALQFIVAAYALRLNRLFGMPRVGWSLFCAFAFLAVLHLAQSAAIFSHDKPSGVPVELLYSFISVLLLTGMVHLETVLKERGRREAKERQMRDELEAEVKKKTAYLMRAIEELQAEMDERKRMETKVAESNTELCLASRQVKAAEMAINGLDQLDSMLKSVNAAAALVADPVKQAPLAQELASLKKKIEQIMAIQQSCLQAARPNDTPEVPGLTE